MTLAPLSDPDSGVVRWANVLVSARQLAEVLADTDFVPRAMRGKPDAVCAAIMYGDEVGVGPMQALASIDVIEGRPQPSAELVRALILAAGHDFTVHEMTGLKVRVSGLRAGEPESARTYVEWSIDMARAAGLLGKKNWREYPRSMLVARASWDLGRVKFPDVIKGLGRLAGAIDDVEAVQVSTDAEPPPPVRPPLARKARPRLPSPGRLPIATDDHPAPDGSVDVPLPADDMGPLEPMPAAPGDDDDPWTKPGPDPWKEDAPDPDAPAKWPRPADDDATGDASGEPEPPPDGTPPARIGEQQRRAVFAMLGNITGHAMGREERLAICAAIIGRDLSTSTDLTRAEGFTVLDYLTRVESGAVGWTVDPDTGAVTLHTYRDD